MDRAFKSKVSWWYHLLLLIMVASTISAFVTGQSPALMITLLLSTLLCIHILLSTWYRITANGILVAHCSIFPEKRIKIEEITAVESTVLPVSSYALSLDSLIIYRGKQQWLLVSPKEKKEFIRCLKKYNPDIKVKDSQSLFF